MSILLRHGLPHAPPGSRVGLLGGSFDPPHRGHVHITREALKRLGLDRVWWLVSPGNPLKKRGPAPLSDRLAAARAVMDHPRVEITDIETRLRSHYTARTLSQLQRLYPGVHFVWLMGADNLAGFHHWQDWQGIMRRVPVAVFARPGARVRARRSKAALRFAQSRIKAREGGKLALRRPPVWVFLSVPMRDISSTGLRIHGKWPPPSSPA